MYFFSALLWIISIGHGGLRDVSAVDIVPAAECGINPMDIEFLLDSSAGVGEANFKLLREYLLEIISGIDIGPDATQIGVTTFTSMPFKRFWMKTYATNSSLTDALSAMYYSDENGDTSRDLARALNFVRDYVFSAIGGSRDGVMKVLIIITNGGSDDPEASKAAAARLHRDGILVIVVYIAPGTDRGEYADIISDSRRFFRVQNYGSLSLLDELLKILCAVCPYWVGTDSVVIDWKCIRLFTDRRPWDQAQDVCRIYPGGNLLEVTSEPVMNYTAAKTKELNIRSWLGGTDEGHEGEWMWASRNETMDVDPSWWGEGQPDNWRGNENCMIMRPDQKFNDYRCDINLPYFCEIPA